ncbi:MAG TPA: ArsA-related P-loop ATPase [Vicinamibacteria bacterium]|nr:ArsA-related P-loop ATPase [Vicinamibacteria bacterium]
MRARPRRPAERLAHALTRARVLVVCGSGGVGKTTTAAALGLRAALDGRRVLVCTIDPSRRLATSLGLQSLSGRPRALDIGAFTPARGGALFAMTLDTKGTFDALVERYARDEAARKRILGNRFYREVSAALSGSHEYMAMEKLLELAADDRYDLVVLDTPPTRHALDFLEAPERLLSFLDSSVLRFFLRPYFVAGRLTLKVATRTGAIALKLADRFLGLQFLQDLSEFFLAFESMYDGFKERAEKVFALLRDETSGFVLVAGPSGAVLDEALYFHGRLKEKRMPFVAFVVNRVHPLEVAKGRAARGRLPDLPRDFQARLLDVHEDYRLLRRAEVKVVDRLEVDAGEAPILVAEREADVHDLRGLYDVASSLLPL